MKVKIIENSKNRIKFELEGRQHTLCNALSSELWNDKDITAAGYTLEHPLISNSILVVETKSGDAKKALLKAIDRLKKTNNEFLGLCKKVAK
ncbi:DNA-directed RNA polymerase subunit L [Candidatus Woesearchaeota archaeon]|nr:MAG: DNA-directed RNA polymerase subunit L [Candidatus Woesearchaeota archaeon]